MAHNSGGTKSTKVVYEICKVCGGPKKTIMVILGGKRKQCLECGCGVFDKSGKKVE